MKHEQGEILLFLKMGKWPLSVSFTVLKTSISNSVVTRNRCHEYLNCMVQTHYLIHHHKSAQTNDLTASFTSIQHLYPDKRLTTDRRWEWRLLCTNQSSSSETLENCKIITCFWEWFRSVFRKCDRNSRPRNYCQMVTCYSRSDLWQSILAKLFSSAQSCSRYDLVGHFLFVEIRDRR